MVGGDAENLVVEVLQATPEIIIADARILCEPVRNCPDVLFHKAPQAAIRAPESGIRIRPKPISAESTPEINTAYSLCTLKVR